MELIPEALPDETDLPFWGHVTELRDRLIRCLIALAVATSAAYYFRFTLWAFARRPLLQAMSSRLGLPPAMIEPFSYTDLAEPFLAFMRLSFWSAAFAISPYLFYQLWAFVRPALRESERALATVFVVTTSACFVAGALFAYFVAFPVLGDLLLDEALKAGLRANLRPNEYLNLFLCTVVGTGISFEAPVLFYFLGRFGLVSSAAMLRYWREATLGILMASAFLTPGDLLATTILFGGVLLALYFVSTLVVKLVE